MKWEKEFKTVGELVDFLQGFDRTMHVLGRLDSTFRRFPVGNWTFKIGTLSSENGDRDRDVLEIVL